MDRPSIRAIKVYSKYGATVFYLYVLLSIFKTHFNKKNKFDYGWSSDFSFGQAPNHIKVRKIESNFANLSKTDFEENEVKEDIYPLS